MLRNFQSYLQMLRTDPLGFVVYLAYYVVVLLLSLILHECGHAYVAYRCGDPTAKMLGRLTLDPRKHLDPVGTVMMLLFGFGYAKPVPINPRNFRNYRRDDFLVSIAGITVNFSLFLVCLALAVGVNRFMWTERVYQSYTDLHAMDELLSPYAGSIPYWIAYAGNASTFADYMANPWLVYVQRFLLLMCTMNLSLAVFNFLPVPPLDGFHIFNDIVLKGRLQLTPQIYRVTMLVLMGLLYTGVLYNLLYTVNEAVYGGVLKLFLLITGAA